MDQCGDFNSVRIGGLLNRHVWQVPWLSHTTSVFCSLDRLFLIERHLVKLMVLLMLLGWLSESCFTCLAHLLLLGRLLVLQGLGLVVTQSLSLNEHFRSVRGVVAWI